MKNNTLRLFVYVKALSTLNKEVNILHTDPYIYSREAETNRISISVCLCFCLSVFLSVYPSLRW